MAKLVIRVDGDSGRESGMGHVYRSLAYARLLLAKRPGVDIYFLMRNFPEGILKVKQEGHHILTLPITPSIRDYRRCLQQLRPKVLVIDTLGSTEEIIQAAREHSAAIISLDDLNPSAYKADIIINGILWATEWLPNRQGEAYIYQGIEYLQLREQFADANRVNREISPMIQEILISTGGADGREFTPQLIEAIAGINFKHNIKVNVIVGPAFKKKASIEKSIRSNSGKSKFNIIENTQEMARLLLKADLALVTGGTVMFESVACGTPSIVLCSYEHQVPQADWFATQGAIRNLGYFPISVDAKRVGEEITKLHSRPELRYQMSMKGKAIVDAKGIYRVVDIINKQLCEQENR